MQIKNILTILFSVLIFGSCQNKMKNDSPSRDIHTLFENYYQDRLKIFPIEASIQGDNRYNNLLPVDISESYRETERNFFRSYLDSLKEYKRESLKTIDQDSYDILRHELEIGLAGLSFNDYLMPINQFSCLTLVFGQMGTGTSFQPFKNAKDYDDFLGRVNGFQAWCDTAISNMRRGMAEGVVQPKILMERVLPQLAAMDVKEASQSIFYMPVKNFPETVSAPDRERLDSAYRKAIMEQIVPSYRKLHDFIKDEYISKCVNTAGIGALPGGKELYAYDAKYWTTTDMNTDAIFDLGNKEVARLRAEMEKIKEQTGFKGDLKSFFTYLNTDKKFFPFHSPEEVIAAFNQVHERMKPQLKKLFDVEPKTKFEVRRTEQFREASSSAEYNQGTPDGSRPGIFYTPIPDATKFNTFGMEDLFLHEAIPGHHYQISLAQENDSLPKFRRFLNYGAYDEGWALYTESLGKELGLYTDPYQYFGALSEEMHRAIRLVVDVGMHLKGWTREQAIEFSLENEGESKEAIISEIERYMAYPGQALSYKIGQLKIRELRARAEKELGASFSIAKFHDAILDSGSMPLSVLEGKVNRWIEAQKKNS